MSLLLARMLHGITTLRCPAAEWRLSPFWGRYNKHRFAEVVAAVTESLVRTKTKLHARLGGGGSSEALVLTCRGMTADTTHP